MAVTCTLLTSGTAVNQARTLTIPACTVPNGKACLVVVHFVAAAGELAHSPIWGTAAGLTDLNYVAGRQAPGPPQHMTMVLRAVGNGTSHTISVDTQATTTSPRVTWHVVYFDGADASFGADLDYGFRQRGLSAFGTGTTAAVTMAAFSNANNATFFTAGSLSNTVHSSEAGWTELDEQGGSTTGSLRSSVDFKASNDLSPTAIVGNAEWCAVACEVIAAASTSTSANAGNAAGTGAASGEKVTGSTHPFVASGSGAASSETVLREALPLSLAAGGTGDAGNSECFVDVNAECCVGEGTQFDPSITSTGGIGEVLDDPTFTSASTTQASMTFSPAPTAGDLLLAVIGWNANARTVTSVDGWAQIGAAHANSPTAADCNLSFWWKRSAGTESGPQRWNISGAATGMDGQMARYALLSDPVDKQAESNDAVSFSRVQLASGTTATTASPNELLLAAFMLSAVKTLAYTNSFGELATINRLHVATRNVVATGAYSTTASWSGNADVTGAIITVAAQSFVSAVAQNAAGTGSAGVQKVAETPHAGSGAGAGAASNGVHSPFLSVSSGSGAAFAATSRVATVSTGAAGTGSANAPVSLADLDANAGAGSGTGAASAAKDSIAEAQSVIAITGLANAASVSEKPNAGAGAGTGVANAAAGTFVFGAVGSASGSGQAFDQSVSSSSSMAAVPPAATGTGTASPAQVTLTSVVSGSAAGTGAASGPSFATQSSAGSGAGTGAANGTTAPTLHATSEVCTGTGLAASPPLALEFAPVRAEGTGTAFSVVLAPQVNPAAEFGAGTGSAFNAGVTVETSLDIHSVAQGRALALTR